MSKKQSPRKSRKSSKSSAKRNNSKIKISVAFDIAQNPVLVNMLVGFVNGEESATETFLSVYGVVFRQILKGKLLERGVAQVDGDKGTCSEIRPFLAYLQHILRYICDCCLVNVVSYVGISVSPLFYSFPSYTILFHAGVSYHSLLPFRSPSSV